MASPRNLLSVDGASGTTTGRATRLNGHYHLTLFVVATGLDSANDTLTVAFEGSANGENWASVEDASSDKKLTDTDFTEDPDNAGVYTATVSFTGTYHEFIRARITEFTDSGGGDLSVDAYVMAAGNAGQGQAGTPLRPDTDS